MQKEYDEKILSVEEMPAYEAFTDRAFGGHQRDSR